jgi:superfamily II DNA or RNA helicase
MAVPLYEGVSAEEISTAETLDDDYPDTHPVFCCFASVITQIVQLFDPIFQLRGWQREALATIQRGLAGGQVAFLVEAMVGTGKRYVAIGTALGFINGAMPYKAKVLFLSPLVPLAMEQYAYLQQVARA